MPITGDDHAERDNERIEATYDADFSERDFLDEYYGRDL